MGRWRRKLLLSLIIYSAGFASAVYVLAPSSAQASSDSSRATASSGWSANAETWIDKAQANQWAGKLKTGMDKFVSFAEDNALRAAEMIRSKTGQSDQSE